MTDELQNLTPQGFPKQIVAIDQEGGRVRRIKGDFPNEGPARDLAGGAFDPDSLEIVEHYACSMGEQLKTLGVNVNFAPVVDVLTRESNTAIGDRAFGRDLKSVQLRSHAFLRGLQKSGLFGCLKHFPGQGDADSDTHFEQSAVKGSKEELFSREISAFEPLLSDARMVMISHCHYPALSAQQASLSREIVTDVLKGKLGFGGVVVSDDMLMKAIEQDEFLWVNRLIESIVAGVDLLLICRDLDRYKLALEGLRKEAAKSKEFDNRIQQAAKKVMNLRKCLF